MINIKEAASFTNFVKTLFSGGTDNTPVNKEELEYYMLMLDLTGKMNDEEMDDAWAKAMLVAKKRLTWRIQHSHDLSIDRYKVHAASFLFFTAIISITFALSLPAPLPRRYLLLSTVLIIVVYIILRSRNRLWKDYSSSIQ